MLHPRSMSLGFQIHNNTTTPGCNSSVHGQVDVDANSLAGNFDSIRKRRDGTVGPARPAVPSINLN